MTAEQLRAFTSETAKYRHLTLPYCEGCGVDIASQGDCVVPWGISFDLPEEDFRRYSNGRPPKGPIHLRGYANKLPFETGSLDWVYSSHLLEDFLDWWPLLTEWTRVIKPGGRLIVLIPDKALWNAAIAAGQPPNCAHRHEGRVGELSTYAQRLGLKVEMDKLTDVAPGDYTIMFVGVKV